MKSRIKQALWIVVLILCAGAVYADDWPQFRGINNDGISAETGINQNWSKKTFKILWEMPMGDDGYAGPCVVGKTVYIIDRKGDYDIVKAINIISGKIDWEYKYKEDSDENYGFARATPTFDNNKLYIISQRGKLFCLNSLNGKLIWKLDVIAKFNGKLPRWEMAISPVIDGDKLLICPGGKNNLIAINKNDGKVIWKGGNSDMIGYATPVIATIHSVKQYVLFTGYKAIGVNAKDGKVLWSFPWKTSYDVNAAMPLVIDNEYVFITSGYKHGSALLKISKDNSNAQNVWKEENKNMMAHFSSPIYYNGYIFGNSDPGDLVCLDKKSGKLLGKKEGFEKGGLIAVDGVIIALDGRKGQLYVVEAKPGLKELASVKILGGQSWTAPILSDKKLIIRNRDYLACIDLSQ